MLTSSFLAGINTETKEEITEDDLQFSEGNDEAQAWLSLNEFEESDNQLLLRRVINKDGKSKAFINGIPSTISQLKSIGESLVDIYSQNTHHSLLKKTAQREIWRHRFGC